MESPTLVCKNEFAIENEHALLRAAEISSLVTSITIGPNSTFDFSSFEELNKSNEEIKENPKTTPKVTNQRRSSGSRLEISDIGYLKDKMQKESEQRRINLDTFQYLEERQKKENEFFKKLQEEKEKHIRDAERRDKEKIVALEKQIQDKWRLDYEEELQYMNQRKEIAADSRKILEEREKQLEIKRLQIKKYDDSYNTQEAHFVKLLQSCSPELTTIVETYSRHLKDVKSFKEANKSSVDGLKNAIAKLEALFQNFLKNKTEFETLLQAQMAAQQREAEEKRQEEEEAARQAANNIPKPIVLIQPQHAVNQVTVEDNSHSKLQYDFYRQFLENLRNETKHLQEAQELQQLRFIYKLAVNNPINLLSDERGKMIETFTGIFNLLSGHRCSTTRGDVSIADHSQALNWCRLRIAEKLIDRCDKDLYATFSVAAIVIALWQKFPEFGEIFRALLYKECPFFIPYKPKVNKNQSVQEICQSWGFKMAGEKCEEHNLWERRTMKFAGLLAALWITNPRNGEAPNPFGIEHAWTYLANVLNSKPDENYLHILEKIIEIAGSALHQTYKGQFVKLLLFIRDHYMPAVKARVDDESSGSFNRLRDIVNKFFTEHKFQEPKGKLAPGHW